MFIKGFIWLKIEEDQQTQVSHVFFPEWMNEWLCPWHERGFQQCKDFLSSDEEQWKDADYNCSESLVQLRRVIRYSATNCHFLLTHCLRSFMYGTLTLVSMIGRKSAAVHAYAKLNRFIIYMYAK